MNIIKFRGVTTFLNKTVYGDLLHYEDGAVAICPVGKDESAEVYPETVAQFVGYDKNGDEFYSDDEVYILVLDGSEKIMSVNRNFKINDIGRSFFNVRLVKGAKSDGNN